MRAFTTWLHDTQVKKRNIEDMDGVLLNNYIGNFLLDLMKKDVSPHEPGTLTSYHRGIER